MKYDKSTDEVDKELAGMNPARLNDFYKGNKDYMADEEKGFYYYMKDIAEEKNVRFKDMYIRAGVSESYGSKIIRMESHTTNRDLIIRLCIAGHFSVLEINRALKLYGMSELYSKNKRDACIIAAIQSRTYDMFKIDEMLEKYGFPKLQEGE